MMEATPGGGCGGAGGGEDPCARDGSVSVEAASSGCKRALSKKGARVLMARTSTTSGVETCSSFSSQLFDDL